MCRSMVQVNQTPILAPSQIVNDAESWYAQYDGSNSINNMDGMSIDQSISYSVRSVSTIRDHLPLSTTYKRG